jgi:Bardet-Biedl syndrome 4 protein
VHQSLELFQQAVKLNPASVDNLKQLGRSLYLLGKHQQAAEVYEDILKHDSEDWEVWHTKGLCQTMLGEHNEAEESFRTANAIHKHDATFIQLGRCLVLMGRRDEAIEVCGSGFVFRISHVQRYSLKSHS